MSERHAERGALKLLGSPSSLRQSAAKKRRALKSSVLSAIEAWLEFEKCIVSIVAESVAQEKKGHV
jgi:hypothetical protein